MYSASQNGVYIIAFNWTFRRPFFNPSQFISKSAGCKLIFLDADTCTSGFVKAYSPHTVGRPFQNQGVSLGGKIRENPTCASNTTESASLFRLPTANCFGRCLRPVKRKQRKSTSFSHFFRHHLRRPRSSFVDLSLNLLVFLICLGLQ